MNVPFNNRDEHYTTNSIGNVSRSSSAQTIENALRELEGVIDANVNLSLEFVEVTYSSDHVSRKERIDAIMETGYVVPDPVEVQFLEIGGMSCAGCAHSIPGGSNYSVFCTGNLDSCFAYVYLLVFLARWDEFHRPALSGTFALG